MSANRAPNFGRTTTLCAKEFACKSVSDSISIGSHPNSKCQHRSGFRTHHCSEHYVCSLTTPEAYTLGFSKRHEYDNCPLSWTWLIFLSLLGSEPSFVTISSAILDDVDLLNIDCRKLPVVVKCYDKQFISEGKTVRFRCFEFRFYFNLERSWCRTFVGFPILCGVRPKKTSLRRGIPLQLFESLLSQLPPASNGRKMCR